MTPQRYPLSKHLLSSWLGCVSLSFRSFTTCEECSTWSGYGLHLFRSLRKPHVLPATDWSPKVAESTNQASFCVTLLHVTLVQESTYQEIIDLQFFYWCMVVLWSGWYRSGDLHYNWWRHLSCFPLFFGHPGFFFLIENKVVFGLGEECRGKGWKRDEKGQIFFLHFFWPHMGYVWGIDRITGRVVHVRSRTVSLKISPAFLCIIVENVTYFPWSSSFF